MIMARKHLWIRSETTKVESKYHDNALLLSLRAPALEYAVNAHEFSLTIGELFYNSIYSIDQIKSIEGKQERLAYCSALWDEVYEYILNLADGNEDEQKDAASLTVITVAQCLYAADKLKYYDEIMALYTASEKRNKGKGQQMLVSLKPLVDERVNAEVRTWLSEYIISNVFISDDIEDDVHGMRNHLSKETEKKKVNVKFKGESCTPYPFVTISSLTDAIVTKILSYLQGKSPSQAKDVMKPIRAAQDAGVIRRITFEEMKTAFPEYCPKSKSSVSYYTKEDETPYTEQAFEDMVEEFQKLKNNRATNACILDY